MGRDETVNLLGRFPQYFLWANSTEPLVGLHDHRFIGFVVVVAKLKRCVSPCIYQLIYASVVFFLNTCKIVEYRGEVFSCRQSLE